MNNQKRKHNPAPLSDYWSWVKPVYPQGVEFGVEFRLTPGGDMWRMTGTTPSKAAAWDRIEEYRESTMERERLGE